MKNNLLRRGLVGMLTLMLVPGMCPVNVMASEMAEPSEQQIIVTEGEVLVDEPVEDLIQADTFQVGIVKPDINFQGEKYILNAKPIGGPNLNPDNYTYEWFERSLDFWGDWDSPNYLKDNDVYMGTHTDTLVIAAREADHLGGLQSMWFGCRVTSKYPLDEPDPSKRERHSSTEISFIPDEVPKQPYAGMLWFTDLDKPVAGATPDYTGASKNTNYFEFDSIEWYKCNPNRSDEWSLMQPTDQFEVGTYKCHLYYNMRTGLYATGKYAILQNGEYDVHVYYEDDYDFATRPKRYIEAYYDVKNELIDVPFTCLAPPVEGRTLDTSVLSPAGLKVTNVIWSPADTKAVAGKEYTATIVAEAQDGYRISDDANVTVNGDPVELVKFPNNTWHVNYTFPAAASVEKNPAVLSDRDLFMNVSDVFEMKGKGIVLQTKLQYGVVNKGDTLRLTYFDQAKVKNINVTVQELEINNDIYNLLIGAPFGTYADGSVNKDTLAAGAILQKTEQYVEANSLALIGNLQVASGESARTARESTDITCTIGEKNYNAKILSLNGQNTALRGEAVANVVIGDFDAPHLCYLGQPIELKTGGRSIGTFTVAGENTNIDQFVTKVSVNVTAPEIGKAPVQDAAIADGCTGYRVASVYWSPVCSKFAANTEYTVTIKAFADYPKTFTKNVAVFINGEMVTPTSGAETDTLVFSYTFPKLSVTPAGPQITKQPSDQVMPVGTKAVFEINATGEGLQYQWEYSIDGGKTWKNSTSEAAKTSTFSITAAEKWDGMLLRCVVTDRNGQKVTSNEARLSIKAESPTITSQPQSVSVTIGEKASFKVGATGTGLTYQWKYSLDNGTTWKASTATSAKTDTFSITAAEKWNGMRVFCQVTDAKGQVVKSKVAQLTVKAAAPVITTQPTDVTASVGTKASFAVKVTGTGLTYQWKYSMDNGATWKVSTSASANTDTFSIIAAEKWNGMKLFCRITDANGQAVTTKVVRLTVKAGVPTITLQPTNVTAGVGARATFKVGATGTSLAYQWYYSTDRGATWKVSTASSAKTNTFSITAAEKWNGMMLKCTVTSQNGEKVTSNIATLTVK